MKYNYWIIAGIFWLWFLGLSQVGAQASRYAAIDQHALKAPTAVEQSLDKLARYLCPSNYTDEQKTRSIFRWVADRVEYDVEMFRSDKITFVSAEDVLRSRKAVCGGYAELYKTLAQKAGLRVETVSGDTASYLSGGHAWNAVYVGGRWQLLDSTWAAGTVSMRDRFVKEFNEFWFLTPPDQFIYSHLPKQKRWQLLPTPWSEQRFAQLPYYRESFFRLGLTPFERLPRSMTVKGEELITLPFPPSLIASSSLFDDTGKRLDNWAMAQSSGNNIEVRLRCPSPGTYSLHIFATPFEDSDKDEEYKALVELQVQCQYSVKKPFPIFFGQFSRSKAQLMLPLDGQLPSKSRQRFRLRVPGAQELAFYAGDTLFAKTTKKNSLSLFEDTITCPGKNTPLRIYAGYPGTRSYKGLLEYQIQ